MNKLYKKICKNFQSDILSTIEFDITYTTYNYY